MHAGAKGLVVTRPRATQRGLWRLGSSPRVEKILLLALAVGEAAVLDHGSKGCATLSLLNHRGCSGRAFSTKCGEVGSLEGE